MEDGVSGAGFWGLVADGSSGMADGCQAGKPDLPPELWRFRLLRGGGCGRGGGFLLDHNQHPHQSWCGLGALFVGVGFHNVGLHCVSLHSGSIAVVGGLRLNLKRALRNLRSAIVRGARPAARFWYAGGTWTTSCRDMAPRDISSSASVSTWATSTSSVGGLTLAEVVFSAPRSSIHCALLRGPPAEGPRFASAEAGAGFTSAGFFATAGAGF